MSQTTQIVRELLNNTGTSLIEEIPVLGDLAGNPESLDYLDDLETGANSNQTEISLIEEEWPTEGNNNATLKGKFQIPSNVEVQVGGLGVRFGNSSQGNVEVGFSIDLPCDPVLKFLTAWVIEVHNLNEQDVKNYLQNSGSDDQDVPEVLKDLEEAGLKRDHVPDSGTVQNNLSWNDPQLKLGPVDPEFEVPKHWLRKGELVKDNGAVTGIEPAESEQVVVNLTGVSFILSSDSVDIELDDNVDGVANQIVENSPPLLIADTGVAFRLKEATFAEELPSSVLSSDRPVPEDWSGLVIEKLEIWGLNRLLPFLPEKRVVEHWAVNSDGIWGNAMINFSDGNETVRPKSVEFSYAGEWWPETFSVTGCLDAGGLVGDREHLLDFVGDLRLTPPPKETDSDGWSMEFSLSGTAQSDGAIVSLSELPDLGGSLGDLIKLASSDNGDRGRKSDAALVLGAFESLDGEGLIKFNELALDGITAQVRQRTSSNGTNGEETYRELNVNLDVRADCTLQLQDAIDSELFEGRIEDIPLEFAAGDIPVSYNLDAPQLPDLPNLPEFDFAESLVDGEGAGWSFADGLSLSIPGTVDLAGMVTLTEVDLRGLYKSVDAPDVDIDGIDGLKMSFGVDSSGSGDVAVGGLPDVIDIIYYPKVEGIKEGEVDFPGFGIDVQVGRVGQPVSLLVPGALYAQGELSTNSDKFGNPFSEFDDDWGNLLAGRIEAFLVGNGSALDAPKLRSSYNFDLELDILSATRKKDGLQLFILNLQSSFEPGLPLGTSGAAVYGLGLLFAQNGKPDREDGELSYGDWYLNEPTKYTTEAKKWRPAPGHWGFGASTSLGSSMDGGRSWNVSAGLILLVPGPKILVTGRGNLFSKRPTLPVEGKSQGISAPFAAILALDFQRNRFSADLEARFETKALKANIPAAVRADLEDPSNFLLSLGKAELGSGTVQTPLKEDQVRGQVLGLLDVNAFLLLSGKEVNIRGESVDESIESNLSTLPGVALVYGAGGSLDWSFDSGPVSVELWAGVAYAVGASMKIPLLAGLFWAEGGVEASAFGVGVSMEVELRLAGIAPDPFRLEGDIEVSIGLPWPMSDIDTKANLKIGKGPSWMKGAPLPESNQGESNSENPDPVLESVTFWDRGIGEPIVLKGKGENNNGSAEAEGVPIDAVIDVNFRAPVGNVETELGSFIFNGEDSGAPVIEVASTEKNEDGAEIQKGYRHIVKECILEKENTAGEWEQVSEFSGAWTFKTEAGTIPEEVIGDDGIPRTDGGEPARTRLRLMGPLADPVRGRIGREEDLIGKELGGWAPCQQVDFGDEEEIHSYAHAPDWEVSEGDREREILEPETPWDFPNQTPPLDTPARVMIEASSALDKLLLRQSRLEQTSGRITANPISENEVPQSDFLNIPEEGNERVLPEKGQPILEVPKLFVSSPVRPLDSEGYVTVRSKNGDHSFRLLSSSNKDLLLAAREVLGCVRVDLPKSTACRVRFLVARLEGYEVSPLPLCWAKRPEGEEELITGFRREEVNSGFDDVSYDVVEYRIEKEVDGIVLGAIHPGFPSEQEFETAVALLDIRCRPLAFQSYADALETREKATRNVVAQLVEDKTTWEPENADDAQGLLEPGSRYRLTVSGEQFPIEVDADDIESRPASLDEFEGPLSRTWTDKFEFTTKRKPSTDLKSCDGTEAWPTPVEMGDQGSDIHRLADVESIEARWEVATRPADGEKAYYVSQSPVTVRLREARTVAKFKKSGFDLEIRVTDENGNIVFDSSPDLSFLPAKDLLFYENQLRNKLKEESCLQAQGENGQSLSQEVVGRGPAKLAPNTRYTAELRAVGEEPFTLHSWQFRTSRFKDLNEHLESHHLESYSNNGDEMLDEFVLDRVAVLEALQDEVPDLGEITVNDDLLDQLLFEDLGLPPRDPPKNPELTRIWAWDPEEQKTDPVALLLDGPEPLLRPTPNSDQEPRISSPTDPTTGDLPIRTVTGNSRARVLIMMDWSGRVTGEDRVKFAKGQSIELDVYSRGDKGSITVPIEESRLD